MKNIKKLAEEIFKAPGLDEMVTRATRFTKDELIAEFAHTFEDDFGKSELSNLFPNGAYVKRAEDTRHVFKFVGKTIEHQLVGSWQRFAIHKGWQELKWGWHTKTEWFKAKLKNETNVVKVTEQGAPRIYLWEKLEPLPGHWVVK